MLRRRTYGSTRQVFRCCHATLPSTAQYLFVEAEARARTIVISDSVRHGLGATPTPAVTPAVGAMGSRVRRIVPPNSVVNAVSAPAASRSASGFGSSCACAMGVAPRSATRATSARVIPSPTIC